MAESLNALVSRAVSMAQEAGASDAFASASRSREVETTVRDGALETVKDATSNSLSMRLWVDGRYGSHSTNDLREDSLKRFIADAVALTRAVQVDAHRVVPDPSLFEGRAEVDLDLVDAGVQALTREERLALAMAQNAVLKDNPKIISATSGVSDSTNRSAMASSNGFTGEHGGTSLWLGSEVTVEDDGKKPEGWMWGGARHRADAPDPVQIANTALSRVLARIGSVKGPTARTTMVLDPSVSGSLVSRLMRPASGRSLSQGRSFWENTLGERTVNEALTIIDDPLLPRGFRSRTWDGEGIALKRREIMQKGALAAYNLDTYYASKLGMKPTGSWTNMIVKPGTRDLAALIGATKSGIYVTGWLGGNSDSTTGDFSLGLRGHRIENGAIGAPVGEMNITGNLLELFQGLVEVGNDPWPYSSLRCPTLVFENVDFAGA